MAEKPNTNEYAARAEYADKAGDAEKLGGHPASYFAKHGDAIQPEIIVSSTSNTTKYRFFNTISEKSLGVPSVFNETFVSALYKMIVKKYPTDSFTIYFMPLAPNSHGIAVIHIYENSNVNSDGLPQYASGFYNALNGDFWTFGIYNYSVYIKNLTKV